MLCVRWTQTQAMCLLLPLYTRMCANVQEEGFGGALVTSEGGGLLLLSYTGNGLYWDYDGVGVIGKEAARM